ncbi:MAG: hypothetical protein GX620_16395 [Chloroflexi bacterium]|nr:hypothetical protein [Chloroflexota bacterium]
MARPLHLMVLAPTETLLDAADVASIQVTLADGGAIGILPGHAPLLAETIAAPIQFTDSDGVHAVDVASGILRITGDTAVILTSRRAPSSAQEKEQQHSHNDLQFERLAEAVLSSTVTGTE